MIASSGGQSGQQDPAPLNPPPTRDEADLRIPANEWKVEATRCGLPTVRAGSHLLHSRFDPVEEARRAAARVPPDAALVVLGGLGLGYLAEAIMAHSADDRHLVIAEADPTAPERVAGLRNLTHLFSHPRVRVLAGGPPEDIKNYLQGGPVGASLYYLEWLPSTSLAPQWYAALQRTVENTARRRAVNAHTLERFGPIWVRNLAANASILSGAVSLEPWKDAFSGIPALILAGGPSLEKILPDLANLRSSHLLIAVDTATSALARWDVQPDIVAAVDPQYWNTRHLDRADFDRTLVLAETATHPAVFRALPGRRLLMRTRFPLGTLLEDAAGLRGELRAGGSVATAAWDLARHLGCTPMTAAGLDLGFPGGRTHYRGSLSQRLPLIEADRTCPVEHRVFNALCGSRPCSAFDGGTILSDAAMDTYTAWFAEASRNLAERSPAVAGRSGRRIEGMGTTSAVSLTRHAHVRERIDSILDLIRQSPSNPQTCKRVLAACRTILQAVKTLESEASQGLSAAWKARKALQDGDDPTSFVAEMERVDARILNTGGREVISFLMQPIILKLNAGGNTSDPIESSCRLYSEIARSAAYHGHYLQKSIAKNSE